MNTFKILWMIAGFYIGFLSIQFSVSLPKVKSVSTLTCIIMGLIGALTAYTILK